MEAQGGPVWIEGKGRSPIAEAGGGARYRRISTAGLSGLVGLPLGFHDGLAARDLGAIRPYARTTDEATSERPCSFPSGVGVSGATMVSFPGIE